MAGNTTSVHMFGTMVQNTPVTGSSTKYVVTEITNGLTVGAMKANGTTITCKESASTSGTMAESTRVNTLMIRSMGTEFINGKTAGNIKVTGTQENSMASDSILSLLRIEGKLSTVSGKMANV